ncbi:MAG TPA: ABC transporter permease [Streptosporangiaceae bacterium]
MTGRFWLFFLARRLAVLVVLMVVISFLVFSLLYISPGSVIDTLLGTNPRTPDEVRFLTHEYHLDKSFWEQYWLWASQALQLHFGNSIQTSLPVASEIKARLPTSLFLGVYAYILTMLLGVGGGIMAALRRRSVVDRGIVGSSMVALSTPAFVSGVFLIWLLAIKVRWFPVSGPGSGFADELWHLTLPAVALALTGTAYLVKHTRAAMIGVLDQDYVTFARARGLSTVRVLFTYALRNALIPVVTISGVILSYVIVGAVLVEDTFSVPGIGQLLVQSATAKDLPMIQGVAMLVAVVIIVANLLADIAYIAVDPRIRLGRRSS